MLSQVASILTTRAPAQYNSDRGSHRETVILGRIYYLGSVYSVRGGIASGAEGVGSVRQDFHKAREYFLKVARAMWPTDPKLIHINAHGVGDGLPEGFSAKTGMKLMSKEAEAHLQGPAGVAAGFLGRMYLRGEGVEKDYLLARMWLKRASDLVRSQALRAIRATC
jgi:SEL1 protein